MTQMRIEHHFPRIEHLQSLLGADPRRRLIDALAAAIGAGRRWATEPKLDEVRTLLPAVEADRLAALAMRMEARTPPEPDLSTETARIASVLETMVDNLQRDHGDPFTVSKEAALLREHAERLRAIADKLDAALDLRFALEATAHIRS